MSFAVAAWVEAIGREYLDDFVPDGGASVKFAVADRGGEGPGPALLAAARQRGFLVATVDAAVTRVYEIDKLFHEVARQVPWRELAADVRARAVKELGWERPATGETTFASIGSANGLADHLVENALNRWFTDKVFKDYRLSEDFRMAMMFLCLEPMRSPLPDASPLEANIVDWLHGELRLLSAVKRAQIYQKIARHNARDLFVSLGHWARSAGRSGLCVAIDARQIGFGSRTQVPPGTQFYGKRQLLDFYEVLRQFIDATGELESTFIAVVMPPEFTNDDLRGMRAYRALEARVAEEVRDRSHDNPMGTLVRVEEG